jgi:rhodanese-related sulfurtransferase
VPSADTCMMMRFFPLESVSEHCTTRLVKNNCLSRMKSRLGADDESSQLLSESEYCQGGAKMVLVITTICAVVLLSLLLAKRMRDRRELERYSMTPEALHALMASNRDTLVIDVREPLDLLGDSVIIPGAQWFAPEEVRSNPSLLPKERDLIVYCTCPSDKTSRMILQRALALGFLRIKFLRGGLDGWRSKGFPVEPYTKSFHLNSGGTNYLEAAH